MKRLFASLLTKKSRTQKSTQIKPRMECLEDRLMPVVGAFANPVAVMPGAGWDGVVGLDTSPDGTTVDPNCTGSLMSTGRHILTAAHCVTDGFGNIDVNNMEVEFELPGQNIFINVPSSRFRVHPEWTGSTRDGNDIAILELPVLAPSGPSGTGADRYDIYRGTDEVGRVSQPIGYGRTGTGATGQVAGTAGTKRTGINEIGTTGSVFADFDFTDDFDLDNAARWLVSDFDDGSAANDILNDGVGFGAAEAATGNGDSGGPVFVNGLVAGVNSTTPSDGDGMKNNFGDLDVFARVSSYAGWIDSYLDDQHDLILDMDFQLPGNDGTTDTIVAKRNGNNVELWVNGDLFHSEDVSKINTLFIKGSDDRDQVTIEGDLGVTVSFDGRNGDDRFTVEGNSSGNNADVDSSKVRMGIRDNWYINTEELFVETADGADTIRVYSFPAVNNFTVNAGYGNDTFKLYTADSPTGNVSFWGSVGTDTFEGANRTNTWDLTFYGKGSLNSEISFSGMTNLKGGTSADTFAFSGNGHLSGWLDGGSGSDKLDYSGYTSPISVSLLSPTTISASRINGTISSIESVVGSSSAGDVLNGPNATMNWYVSGDDTGSLANYVNYSKFTFRDMENLNGGSSNDDFRFSRLATVSGAVNGGAGSDSLSYTDYFQGVLVNLYHGHASNVSGGIVGLENVTGSSYDDFIRGNNQGNTLSGWKGNDIILGMGGNDHLSSGDGRSILIGGDHADTIVAGDGDDIIIEGYTIYDQATADENLATKAFMAFRDTWTRTDLSAQQRAVLLYNGVKEGGVTYYLNDDSVIDDRYTDKITGNDGRDWFFASLSEITDFETEDFWA